jgi:hypothetical protein
MTLKKKLIFLLLVAASLGSCGGGSGDSTEPVVTAPAEAPALQSFTLLKANNPDLEDDIEFNIDGSTVSARLPTDAAVTALVPSFSYTGTQVTSGGAVQISGETTQDFTQVLTYTLSNSAGSNKTYQIDLTRFTGLPIIYLTTDAPVVSKEEYVNGTFELDGGRDYPSIDQLPMELRGRGNSTWFLHPKKPYQMKLESKRSPFGMLEDKKWLFLAEYSDKTLLRNHLAFSLGKRSTLKWTPTGHFAEVFVNGTHDGTYHITEKVEDGANRVDIGDTGFLLEIDQPDRLDPDDVFFQTDTYLINIKEPSLDYTDPEYAQVQQHINQFESVLFSDDFDDPNTGYAAYADVDSFIDWFLVNEIAKNVDAQWYSSIFLHWIPGEKIRMGPLWDFDLGFGNVDYADATFPEGWWVRWNTWISRMLEDPAFAQRVKERYQDLNSQRVAIKSDVYAWSERLDLSQAENDTIWQTIGTYVWPNPVVYDTYEKEVEHLVNWLDTRMDWLSEAIENL